MNDKKTVEKILKGIEELYGSVPVVSQVLSERPDLFIPYSGIGRAAMENGSLEPKMRYLMAVAAATALGSEHCIEVQMDHAIQAGATKDEILETMFIASYMAMTRSQSYAFRKYAAKFQSDE